MNICVVGAGAMGLLFGTRLAAAGFTVSVLARGATLPALREHGLRLDDADGRTAHPVLASDDPTALGAQDLVLLTTKAPALPALADSLGPLLHAETMVLSIGNGLPWWFGAAADGSSLTSLDPQGKLSAALPQTRIVGAVAYLHSRRTAPGIAEHVEGRRLLLGEPAGQVSPRVTLLADMFRTAGFDATATTDIRKELWTKLWGTITVSPISLLTGVGCDLILADSLVERLVLAVMNEVEAVGSAVGCAMTQTAQERNHVTRGLGAFKPSMARDAEAGLPVELDAIVTAVHELAQRHEIATPQLDTLLGLARLRARALRVYPDG
ncbi:MAG: 2-dehydropantoate 2-reductase [Pseudomonadota bacterium]